MCILSVYSSHVIDHQWPYGGPSHEERLDGLDFPDTGLHRVPSNSSNDAAGGTRAQRGKCDEKDTGRRIRGSDMFARIISYAAVIILSPILVPLAFYIALTYSWEDTVPTEEDL
jgi:hypothetical protein